MPITETPAQVLDCKGLQCPMPVIKTAQAIKTMSPARCSSSSPPTRASSPT